MILVVLNMFQPELNFSLISGMFYKLLVRYRPIKNNSIMCPGTAKGEFSTYCVFSYNINFYLFIYFNLLRRIYTNIR